MVATFDLPVTVENKKTKLKIRDSEIVIPLDELNVTIPYSDIKSLQVKNAENFLLKIKGSTSVVILQFMAPGPRDLAKAVIMDAMAQYETVKKVALDKNLDTRALHSSLKRSNLKNIVDSVAMDAEQNSDLYIQRSVADIFSKDFLNALTQPLVDTFIEMNSTLNQFYNNFIATYFYDIKNPKGSLDRLLAENIRNSARGNDEELEFKGNSLQKYKEDTHGPGEGNESDPTRKDESNVAMDYATRINTYSLMMLATATAVPEDTKSTKKKEIEFSPAIPFDIIKPGNVKEREISNPNPFEIKSLICEFKPEIIGPCPVFQYDPKDFELARDICKIAYQQKHDASILNEAMEFSTTFKEMILGQYGEESMNYVERLIPSFYISSDHTN